MNHRLARALPFLVFFGAVAVAIALVATRQAPERRVVEDRGPLVEAIEAPARSVQVIVESQGSVQPVEEIDLVPQVPGAVVWRAPHFDTGGFVERGEVILRLDPRDYDLAVTRAEATVARARYQLQLAREEAAVAQDEWDLVQRHAGAGAGPSDLVLRIPQVRAAAAELQAAEAGLAEAQLRRQRTELRAPFDGRVRQVGVDVGQFAMAGQPVARLYSIEGAEVRVSVPDEDMEWLRIPAAMHTPRPADAAPVMREPDGGEGPAATALSPPRARISGDFAGRRHSWNGRVVRAAGELDPRNRMLDLVVEVADPYGGHAEAQAPLLVGMFVDVEIVGQTVDDVRQLPRSALRENGVVWVADAAGALRFRPARVVHVRGETVLVRLDLAPGERVITSQLSGVTDGMRVRTRRDAS